MTDKGQKTIRIKWVRSGIGFDRSQSKVVRSLGLRRLNHVVERPDTPQVRGLVAKVAHLVEVVRDVSEPVWNSTPAYTVKPALPEPATASGEGFSARSPAAGVPTPSPEPVSVTEESASASSFASRVPTPWSEPATAPEESVSSDEKKDEKDKE